MAKSAFNKVVKDLNQLVKKHRNMVILFLGAIVILSLAKNMFKAPKHKKKKEGFTGKKEIVYFHMNGCGHCKKFNPEWEKFVQGTDMPNKKIDADSGDPLINKIGVSGYPTVVIIENDKKIQTFDGERTANELHEFVKKHK